MPDFRRPRYIVFIILLVAVGCFVTYSHFSSSSSQTFPLSFLAAQIAAVANPAQELLVSLLKQVIALLMEQVRDLQARLAALNAEQNAAENTSSETVNGVVPETSESPAVPVISDIVVSNIIQTQATISWTTDRPATTQVLYGLTNAYNQESPYDERLANTHRVTLTNLMPGTTYHFAVRSGFGVPATVATVHIPNFSLVALVGANWNQVLSELMGWHQFGEDMKKAHDEALVNA